MAAAADSANPPSVLSKLPIDSDREDAPNESAVLAQFLPKLAEYGIVLDDGWLAIV